MVHSTKFGVGAHTPIDHVVAPNQPSTLTLSNVNKQEHQLANQWHGCSSRNAGTTSIGARFIPGKQYRKFIDNGYRTVVGPSPRAGLDLHNYRNNAIVKLVKLSDRSAFGKDFWVGASDNFRAVDRFRGNVSGKHRSFVGDNFRSEVNNDSGHAVGELIPGK
ncbi:uncharacterized protein PGTG_14782 [Puccinia graminis f. sp. tritici CRL 75-36-700-3]|uniref:Uncharacterized protein n=1 Tax=Puccinia graminis f. sp. tritici (strain CRL 75-36-700-3 / race SCCL) TaxID=418459 RepID=E3KWA2_PUCGT|nr:uncharacterized protein PGTG_14782 [Puccinia graminis f. sp. tritici CRL 75-36-700-3]EFP88577.2 hypothetical protein PGTG_14782 [Puccinia graminis f. sp. tritici CRL 75-36-700-3]